MDRSTAKRFEDLGAARGWIAETFAEWEADLTDAERVALNEYKRTGHRDINEALRLGDLEGSSVEGLVQALDVALSRMRLPEPVITWRGSIEHDLYAALETLPGDIIEDAGFVSASLLRRIAEASPARRQRRPSGGDRDPRRRRSRRLHGRPRSRRRSR